MKTYKERIKELASKSKDTSSNPFAQKLKAKNEARKHKVPKNLEDKRKMKTHERL